MTSYAWPAGPEWQPRSCTEPVLVPNKREFVSGYSSAYQGIDLLGERFSQNLQLPPVPSGALAGARAAYFNRLRGVHFATVYALARPQPAGTQRGTPTLSANVAQGAASLPLANVTPGASLLAGDMLGCGGQLFQVAADVTFGGTTGTVATTNRARAALTSGAAVLWDAPTCDWRVANLVEVLRVPGRLAEGADVELVQVW